MAGDGQQLEKNLVALTSGGKTSRLFKAGDIIGDSYRLKGLIGRGGMGYVFRAEHIVLGEDYALKILAPDQINQVTWNRFQSEGKAIARLDHLNIVKIYNMGVERGDFPYYVMDLLDGIALSDCIKDNLPLSIDEILDIFIQLASGFGYAHSHGIIHRDVKPSNVMLMDTAGQFPTVKIVDFGIAKLTEAKDLDSQSLTATGEIFGSPYYMSPEQCLGDRVDHRSDIYSLGCTLFEALCRRPPFVGESAVQTVMMHQNKPSPSLESAGGKFSSDEMEALVAKMLMKRPSERYQSMDQVLHDLDRIRQRKAVGKNVETGFKTSVDSQLKDFGSRYELDQKNKARRKSALKVCIWLMVGLVACLSTGILMQATRPSAKPRQSTPAVGHVSTAEYTGGEESTEGSEISEVTKKLASVSVITSTTDKKKGTRVFHCPKIHIGTFTWIRGERNISGFDYNARDDGRVDAYGEATVPAAVPISLICDGGCNRDVWLCPQILSKFGPDELTGLAITSQGRVEDLGSKEDARFISNLVLKLVKAVSGWTNCQYFEFHNVQASEQALIELDKNKSLRQLFIRGSDLQADVLAKRRFLHQLAGLTLGDLPDLEAVFVALKGSTALNDLRLNDSQVTPVGLRALASCPNLLVLSLQGCPSIDNDKLSAISSIKSLKELQILRGGLKPEQMPYLINLRFIERIDLDLKGWPIPARKELYKVLPNALSVPKPSIFKVPGQEPPMP